MLVENCYFANNEKCITNGDKVVNHCIFENNEYGLYMTERVSVSHSTFTNHSKIALYGGRGELTNCIVTDNNIGVRAFYEGLEIDNCDISNKSEITISIAHLPTGVYFIRIQTENGVVVRKVVKE
ncbi:MAG: T9SS type A sorting domain-containing protein [Bacteroidales bacterium]|nr:T9SS type A sorting domain-containing protein [Bacteroidales bacterium]